MKAFLKRWVFPVLAMSLLAACGGGGGGGTGGGPTPAVSEGTPGQPVDLGLTPPTHAGSVAASPGTSYYTFVTNVTGTYEIALTQTASDLMWNFYVVTDFSGTPLPCDNDSPDRKEICQVDIHTPGRYYLTVFNWDTIGATYNLTITPPTVALYFFDFNNGLQGWTSTGSWGVTNLASHSAPNSVTDSPGGNYVDSADTTLTSPPLSLANADPAKPLWLKFFHKYDIEMNADFGFVEVSIDGGVSWSELAGDSITGVQGTFVQATRDLSAYIGSPSFMIRFRLQTNADLNSDGWYIDDVVLQQ